MKTVSLDRYLEARQVWKPIGKYEFLLQRPTELDVVKQRDNGGRFNVEFAARYVINWKGVLESDFLPDGFQEEVEFSSPLFCKWIEDKPELWLDIANAIAELYIGHQQKVEERGNG